MSEYVTLGIVDKQPEYTVIWHVQTDPEAAARLSGAWQADEQQAASLLAQAHVVEVGSDALGRIHQAIVEEVARLKAVAKEAKKVKPSLTEPRFSLPAKPDTQALAENFHGDEVARECWAHAIVAAELVEAWNAIESTRLSRKYFEDEFGSSIRALPGVSG